MPIALLALFLASGIDYRWESHVAHFWLVLTAALVTLGLAYGVGWRRNDGATRGWC